MRRSLIPVPGPARTVVVALGIALAACVHAVAATSSDERIVVLHGRGHKWNPEHSLRDQEGVRDHYRYVEIAVSAGDVHFGGWFVDDLGGMLILGDRATVDTARAWAYEDPAVQAGLLSVKVTAWSVPIRAEDPIVTGALLPDVRAILRYEPGPNFDLERTYREQREIGSHLAFLGELRERGRIALGGPLLDDTEQDGIYMGMPGLDGEALLVALQRDPAVGAGLLVPSTRDWVVLWKPTDAP